MMFSQDEALDLVLAAILAHGLKTPPVWLALIAPPSSGKTSLLDLLPSRPLPKATQKVDDGSILALDCLTPRTLLSGLSNRGKTGLLERVSDATLLVRELSTLSTRSRDAREVFGLLRRVYDGQMDSAWGTGKTTSWQGRITMVFAGVMHPASLDAELGARILTLRLNSSATDYGRILGKPWANPGQVLGQASQGNPRDIEGVLEREVIQPTETLLRGIAPAAEALATLRATVRRNRDHDVVEAPLVEAPHRLIGQMGGLGAGLATVWQCGLDDPRIVDTMWRIVGSTAPPPRLAVLQVLAKTPDALPVAQAVAQAADCGLIGRGTAQYALDDLRLLEVVKVKTKLSGKQGRPSMMVSLSPGWGENLLYTHPP